MAVLDQGIFLSSDIGTRVRVERTTGEVIEGWLVDQYRYGLLISLDPDGNEVRWFPDDWRSVQFLIEEPRANFVSFSQEELSELRHRLEGPVSRLLTTTDLNRLREVGTLLSEACTALGSFLGEAQSQPYTPTWPDDRVFVRAYTAYSGLQDLLDQSAASELIQAVEASMFTESFVASVSEWEQLSLADEIIREINNLYWITLQMPAETEPESAHATRTSAMSALSAGRIQSLSQDLVASVTERLRGPTGDDSPNPGRGRRYHWAAGWCRTVGGGLITAVDLAGGAASLLGGPAALAIAVIPASASIYKGLKLAAEGLDELGNIADQAA